MTEHAESWVKMNLGLDGTMEILDAPDEITIPLAWLTGNTAKRAQQYVTLEKDMLTFLPTVGAGVSYKVTGINLQDKRFIGVKV